MGGNSACDVAAPEGAKRSADGSLNGAYEYGWATILILGDFEVCIGWMEGGWEGE